MAAGLVALSSCGVERGDAALPATERPKVIGGVTRDAEPEADTTLDMPLTPPDEDADAIAPLRTQAEVDAVIASSKLEVARSLRIPGSTLDTFVVEVPGAKSFLAWEDLAALVPSTGRYPVVVGGWSDDPDESEFSVTVDNAQILVEDEGDDAAGILEMAQDVDLDTWWGDRVDEMEITDDELEIATPFPPADDEDKDVLVSTYDFNTEATWKTVEIALVPTSKSWEVPAYLLWGGWNDVPFPEEHVAVLEDWQERYGAQLFAMTGDVVELLVARPPVEDDDVIDLTQEQFAYAPDVVWQGVGDAEQLASLLDGASTWYFWWD